MTDRKQKICVLGSTGSIGGQTLDVIRKNGGFAVTGLAAGRDAAALEAQVREFMPRRAFLWDEAAARDLEARVRDMVEDILKNRQETGAVEQDNNGGYRYVK